MSSGKHPAKDTFAVKTHCGKNSLFYSRRIHDGWANHYQAWQGSGLTKKQYCVNHGITPSSFFNWVSKFEKSSISQNAVSASERFIRADVIPDCEPTQALPLALGDIRVYFDRGVSSSEINGWITALRLSQC